MVCYFICSLHLFFQYCLTCPPPFSFSFSGESNLLIKFSFSLFFSSVFFSLSSPFIQMECHLLGGLAVPMKSIFTGEDLFRAFNSVHVDWKKVVWIWDIFATVTQIEKNGNNFNMCIVVSVWELGLGSRARRLTSFLTIHSSGSLNGLSMIKWEWKSK